MSSYRGFGNLREPESGMTFGTASVPVSSDGANSLRHEIRQIFEDLKLESMVKVEWK